MTQLEALRQLVDICSMTALNGYDDPVSGEACDIVCNMISKMERKQEKAREVYRRKKDKKWGD